MKGLREKFHKNEGFTLVEMLIVVAIIAILVAVSIPMVAGALDRAKSATDAANVRAAIAVASIEYLQTGEDITTAKAYNASTGKLDSNGGGNYAQATGHTGVVWVKTANGEVSWAWGTSAPTEASGWSKGAPEVTD